MKTIIDKDIKNTRLFDAGLVTSIKISECVGYHSFKYTPNNNNCKLCTIDNAGYAIAQAPQQTVAAIQAIVAKACKACFIVNLTNENALNTLAKHFDLVYCNAIPLGYGNGSQFHACFVNNEGSRAKTYRNNLKAYAKKDPSAIEIALMQRREDKSKELTNDDLLKIMSYKSKYHLQKFLAKKMIK